MEQLAKDVQYLTKINPYIEGEISCINYTDIKQALVQLRNVACENNIDFQQLVDCFERFILYGTFTRHRKYMAVADLIVLLITSFYKDQAICYNVTPLSNIDKTKQIPENMEYCEYKGYGIIVPIFDGNYQRYAEQVIQHYIDERARYICVKSARK